MPRLSPLIVLPLLAFAALAVALVLGAGRADGAGPAGYLDRPLPAFDQPPMAGTEAGFSSADLSGQVILLNVFASWCSACRQEHPMLLALAESGDVPLYGLNWKDRPGAGKVFLSTFGDPYLATASDEDGQLGNALQVTGVPETYVIDAQGRIRYRHLGPITEKIWAEVLRPLIDRLEGET